MGKPAARLTDMHTCPMVTPGMPPIPHLGGPISGPCVPPVLIGFLPAATVGDMCVCVGPPDTIAMGSPTVFIGGKMAARMGDPTMHGGVIVVGCPTVLIGEGGSGGGGSGTAGAGGSSSGIFDRLASMLKEAAAEVKAFLINLYNQGRQGAAASDAAVAAKGPSMKGEGNISLGNKYADKIGEAKAGIEIEGKLWETQKTYLQYGDDDNHLTIGQASAEGGVGYSYDAEKGERFAGAKGKAEAAALKGKVSGNAAHGLVEGEAEARALAVGAEGQIGAEWDDKGNMRASAKAGAEAVLVSGKAKGQIKVTPKTIWDNSCNLVAEGSKYCNAPSYLDHGIVAGVEGEAGIGAAAEVEGAIGKLEEGAWGIKGGAKAGAGPMAGVKAFFGFI